MEDSSRSWSAGCGESHLSGAGSAGRKSTAARQQGRRPSTPSPDALYDAGGDLAPEAAQLRERLLSLLDAV